MGDAEKIISELKKIDGKLLTAIEKILGKNPSKEQLLRFINSNEFNTLIEDLGLRKSLAQYISGFQFDYKGAATGFGAVELTAQRIAVINANLDLIKNSYGRTILGYYGAYTDLLKSKLTASIIEGVDARETIKRIVADTPLTTAQVGAVVNTSYADYSRAGVAKIYEDKPDQRFYYEGGVIPTSSDECKWLYENQNPEGYTKKEIDGGIITPFTHTSGLYIGEPKKIYWFGRQPNYNCRHEWFPVEARNAQ